MPSGTAPEGGGAPEGTPDGGGGGTPEAEPEGGGGGVPEPEGNPEGAGPDGAGPEGAGPEGTPLGGTWRRTFDGMPDGGGPEGAGPEGAGPEGTPLGAPEGRGGGLPEGAPDGTPEGGGGGRARLKEGGRKVRGQRVCQKAAVGEHQTPMAAGVACQSQMGNQKAQDRMVRDQREQGPMGRRSGEPGDGHWTGHPMAEGPKVQVPREQLLKGTHWEHQTAGVVAHRNPRAGHPMAHLKAGVEAGSQTGTRLERPGDGRWRALRREECQRVQGPMGSRRERLTGSHWARQREVGVGYLSLKERRGRKGHQKEARRRGEEANLTGTPWAHRRGSLEPQ